MIHIDITFCEDIRVEATGQLTVVGVWGSSMILSERVPGTIPRFAFLIQITIDPGEQVREFTLRMTSPGMSQSALISSQELDGSKFSGSVPSSFNMMYVFSPFPIHGYGSIKLEAILDQRPAVVREFHFLPPPDMPDETAKSSTDAHVKEARAPRSNKKTSAA